MTAGANASSRPEGRPARLDDGDAEVAEAGVEGSTPRARVVVISGASGSGKTRLARQLSRELGWPLVNLDDFYRDHDSPAMPLLPGLDERDGPTGEPEDITPEDIDWDDAASWDAPAAISALTALCREGRAQVPVYSLSDSARIGQRTVEVRAATHVVAEGIFAPEIVDALRERGLLEAAWFLDRPRTVTAVRRLVRDLAEHRKPAWTLVRRGIRLWRTEPALLAAHVERGAQPLTMSDARHRAQRLQEQSGRVAQTS